MIVVRSITLRDAYASVLKGYNHLIRFASYVATMGNVLEDCEPGVIESELLLMIVEFETSLNRFLAQNPFLEPVKHHMARIAINSIETKLSSATSPSAVFDNFRFLCRTRRAVPSLPADLRERFDSALAIVDSRLRKGKLSLYTRLDNPVTAREKADKHLRVHRAWREWYDQALDMRYAESAGFEEIDLPAFYQQSVDDLVKIPFRASYILDLYDMVFNLARGMSFHNTIGYREMAYSDAAERLAAYTLRLYNWMKDTGRRSSDCEIIAGFLSVFKALGQSYNCDRSFGLEFYRILDCQLPDGSWQTDPLAEHAPENQAEYLCTMYRSTWASIDGLRPLKHDVSNPENAALGLT
jgi:hypothetical protein